MAEVVASTPPTRRRTAARRRRDTATPADECTTDLNMTSADEMNASAFVVSSLMTRAMVVNRGLTTRAAAGWMVMTSWPFSPKSSLNVELEPDGGDGATADQWDELNDDELLELVHDPARLHDMRGSGWETDT